MSVMEGVILCVYLLILQQAVLPVTAQVTLQTEGALVEGSAAKFNCLFTGTFNAALLRQWVGPGSVTLIDKGTSIDAAKYTETIDSANNIFSMTIQNYGSSDDGGYRCLYDFDTSNTVTLSILNAEVPPPSPVLDSVVIPTASEAIDLTISVPGIRPNASASFNLTSSTGTLIPAGTGNAVVTVTDDGNGRTSSNSLKIDVPAGTTSTGDIFTIELLVGAYSETKQWTITASRVCDDCEKTVIPLGSFGMVFALLVAAFCWLLYCLLSGKCSSPLYERAKDGDIEFTTKKLFWSTVIATVLCFLGFVFCLAGVIICALCEEGVTTSGKVTAALILVIIGFALALIIMIVEIILLVLVCCRKIKIKDSTCQRATPDGQEGQPPTTTESNIRTETSPRPLRSPTSASKIKTIWKNNQVSDSNESDASNDTPRGKLSGVPPNRQLPPLAMTDQVDARQKANQLAGVPANRQLPPLATTGQVDASQKANQLEPIENTETKKLKKKKKRRSKEEKAQADDEN